MCCVFVLCVLFISRFHFDREGAEKEENKRQEYDVGEVFGMGGQVQQVDSKGGGEGGLSLQIVAEL